MKNLWRMSLLLMAVCAIAAGCLSYVYSLTKPRIEKQAELEKIQALKEVMPDATRFDTDTVPDRWIAYKGDRKIGFVIEVSASGYGGPIRIIFGVDENKKITKIKILQQNETPGLGARIKEDKFLAQFCGKGKREARLKKDDALNGKIDALSGATISSRAVADAVEKGLLELEQGANTDEIAILKEVFPQAENFRMVSSAQTLKIWAGYEGEKMAGWAVETTAKGFGGPIVILFGLSKSKKITGIKILSHNETAGIGDQISGPEFLWQFQNKSEEEIVLKVDDPRNGKIDTVSGATMSARAITQAVRDAIKQVK